MDCSTGLTIDKQERRRMQNRAAQSKLRRRKAEEKRCREEGVEATPSLTMTGPSLSPPDSNLWLDDSLQQWLSDLHDQQITSPTVERTAPRMHRSCSQSSSAHQLQDLLNEGFISKGHDSMSFSTSTYFQGNGKTPLHLAAEKGHISIATMLLRYGSDIHAKDLSGATPLHYAASNGYTAVVLMLVQANADLHAADAKGWTPLHAAVDGGWEETAQTLLELGAAQL